MLTLLSGFEIRSISTSTSKTTTTTTTLLDDRQRRTVGHLRGEAIDSFVVDLLKEKEGRAKE